MTNKHIIDRRLEERSFLTFNYLSNGEVTGIVTLPFFEHVDIRENKKARLQKYSLLSRSSDLYSYLGADSRELELTFSMTLPHIIDSIKAVGRSDYIKNGITAYANALGSVYPYGGVFKSGFKQALNDSTVGELKYDYFVNDQLKGDVNYIANTEWGQKGITPLEKQKLIERYDSGATLADLDSPIQKKKEGYDESVENEKKALKSQTPTRDALIDTITFWINVIRTCVSNNAKDPTDGPPIIRLNHGILYQDIPCICSDYNISYDKVAGFDIDTLLPRKIDVSMGLKEFRLGDFTDYAYGEAVKRDNLAGWEAVFDKGTIDPGRVVK